MSDDPQIAIKDFISREILFGDDARMPGPREPLIGAGGVVDSVGLNQLIAFVESRFGLTVDDLEITPDNFGTLDAINRFIARKRGA